MVRNPSEFKMQFLANFLQNNHYSNYHHCLALAQWRSFEQQQGTILALCVTTLLLQLCSPVGETMQVCEHVSERQSAAAAAVCLCLLMSFCVFWCLCLRICVRVQACMCARVCAYLRVCVRLHVCVHIHTHTT